MLLPKGLQHPRFESKVAGKGGWIMCHAQALADLASRGSYKRINPKLSMPRNVQALQQYTESQLVLRVAQEIEMFCERAKSWPRMTTMATPFEPIERQQTLELVPDERRQVEMILDLTTSTTSPTTEAYTETVVNWLEVPGGEKQVPVWRLGGSIWNAVLAPVSVRAPNLMTRTTNEPATRTSANPTSLGDPDHSTELLRSITDTLDSTISLFERRRARILEPAATTDLPSEATQEPRPSAAQGKIYVFYSPRAAESRSSDDASDDSIVRIKRDLVDLWISCWRIGLWRGEAWKN
ncbi:uncharacterized protein JCM15063_006098 [Sporobolomyces koalae]|uniref:uncharacterized protein n=1 Tax=Sporobolomyces koalae TaxID=500713 RepID=UPI00316BD8C6